MVNIRGLIILFVMLIDGGGLHIKFDLFYTNRYQF